MGKDIEICFSTDSDVRDRLNEIAKEEDTALSSLVEGVVLEFLDKRKPPIAKGEEKREFQRKPDGIPVIVQMHLDSKESHYHTGTIMDISFGGVRISLPRQEKIEMKFINESPELEILFKLPDGSYTATFLCKPCRVAQSEEDLQVGARFTGADLASQQALHKYIM
ncbi:MAG: PilZ domain-containing protein [Thermodesulfobacteriota bacterium]|nr:PilZ domain-containing protein [Thermodesulfobacteriota bacterium]